MEGVATVFWGLATVKNRVSDNKKTPGHNSFWMKKNCCSPLPNPSASQKSILLHFNESDQNDEFVYADEIDNDRLVSSRLPLKHGIDPVLQTPAARRGRPKRPI